MPPTDAVAGSLLAASASPATSPRSEAGRPTVGRIDPGTPADVYDADGPLARITVDRVREVAGYPGATPARGKVFVEAFVTYAALRPATSKHINGAPDWQIRFGGDARVTPDAGFLSPPYSIEGGPEPALRSCLECLHAPGAEPFSGWLVAEVPATGEVMLSFTRGLDGSPIFEVVLREGTPAPYAPLYAADIPLLEPIGWLGERVVVRLRRRDRLEQEPGTYLLDPASGSWEELPELEGRDGHLVTDGRTLLAVTSGPESPTIRLITPGQVTISPAIALTQPWVVEWIAAGGGVPLPLADGGYLLSGLRSLVVVGADGTIVVTDAGPQPTTLYAPTADHDTFVLKDGDAYRLWDRSDGMTKPIVGNVDRVSVSVAPGVLAWLPEGAGAWSGLRSDGSRAPQTAASGLPTWLSPDGSMTIAGDPFCGREELTRCAVTVDPPAVLKSSVLPSIRGGPVVWRADGAAAWPSAHVDPDRATIAVLVDGVIREFDPPAP